MSLTDDVNVKLDNAEAALDRKGPNPWLVIVTIVTIVAFVIGWRKVTSKKDDAIGTGSTEPGV